MDHPAVKRLIQQGLIQKPSERNVSWPDGAGLFEAKAVGEIPSGPGLASLNLTDLERKQ